MPTVDQNVVTIRRQLFDIVDNPEGAATVNDRESMMVLHQLRKLLQAPPFPRLVLICDYKHVEHLLGAMLLKSGDLSGRLEMWRKVFNSRGIDPREVAQRMAAQPPGTYFIFPEHVAKSLDFHVTLLQPGIHSMQFEYMGRDAEDEIETLKCGSAQELEQFDADRAASAPTVVIQVDPPAAAEPEAQQASSVPVAQPRSGKTWLWILLAYLAGAATSAIVLKTFL